MKLNKKVQTLIDLLDLEIEESETYVTVYLDKECDITMDLCEENDIQYVKKTMFNKLYLEGRHSYKWTFMDKLNDELNKHNGFIWEAVYDYKNPFE
jgi:hypothetical protein